MLLNIAPPPGVYANGVGLQAPGRWRAASLVRWREGVLQPVGGWQARAGTIPEIPRAAHSWREAGGDRWIAWGTYQGLYVESLNGTVSDITPVGLTAGNETSTIVGGFGIGLYGTGLYGAPRLSATNYIWATQWSLDNWGSYLVGCSPDDGRLWEWQGVTATPAAAIAGAPTDCTGCIVSEERHLVAYGASGNLRAIAWSDQGDNTTWTPAATNRAGDIELQSGGEIITAIRVRGQLLFLTESEAHTLTWTPSTFVYEAERVGDACGVVSRRAVATFDGAAYWMGRGGFYGYSGGSVVQVPCEVRDYVFRDINPAKLSHVYAVSNARFGEIWWFYPSGGSTENDRYIAYSVRENHWTVGELARTAGVDSGPVRNPVWAAPDGAVYDHEGPQNYGGAAVFAETAPITLDERVGTFTQLIPDEENQGDATVTFRTRYYPNGDETTHGPYATANPTDLRFTGRQIVMRVDGAQLVDWRVGGMRVEVIPRGKH